MEKEMGVRRSLHLRRSGGVENHPSKELLNKRGEDQF